MPAKHLKQHATWHDNCQQCASTCMVILHRVCAASACKVKDYVAMNKWSLDLDVWAIKHFGDIQGCWQIAWRWQLQQTEHLPGQLRPGHQQS